MKNRTPAYWSTRVLLTVGFIATVIALPLSLEVPMFGGGLAVFGLPASIVVTLVGLALGLVGFAWMLRIFRGPRDEPPVWRYRAAEPVAHVLRQLEKHKLLKDLDSPLP